MLTNYEEARDGVAQTIHELAVTVLQAYRDLYDALVNEDGACMHTIPSGLDKVNDTAVRIDNAIVEILARFSPEGSELRRLVVYLKVVNNIVRVSDNIKSVCKRLLRMNDAHVPLESFTIEKMYRCALDAYTMAIEHLSGDMEAVDFAEVYRRVSEKEECSDSELKRIESEMIVRGRCEDTIPVAMIDKLHLVRKLERTGDRAVDIARLMCYAKEGGLIESV